MTRLTRSTHPSSLSLSPHPSLLSSPSPYSGLTRCPGNSPNCPVNKRRRGFLASREVVPSAPHPDLLEPCSPPSSSSSSLVMHHSSPWRWAWKCGELEWQQRRKEDKSGERGGEKTQEGKGLKEGGGWWEERWLGGIYKSANQHRPVGHGGLLCQQFISHSILAADSELSLKTNYFSIRKVHTATLWIHFIGLGHINI